MLKRDYEGQVCSIARSLELVGDRWTLLIVRDLILGLGRFDEFVESLGIASNVLTDRLNRLVEEEIAERIPYSERPDRFEYRLTDKGRDLYPVVVSLLRWGDRWMTGTAEPPVELRHRACGHPMHPELACPECGEWVDPRDVDATARR